MQVKKQQLEPETEQQTDSKLGKEYVKSVYCHPAYLTYMQRNARLDEVQTGIKIAGRNISHPRYADDTILVAESKEELQSLLMKVKGERRVMKLKGERKSWLKAQHSENKDHGIQSHHLKNFPQFFVINTVKELGIVNKVELDVFWNSLAFLMIH